MGNVGYDVFFTEPDTCDEKRCLVCGTLCEVERSVIGPTGWAEAAARRGHWHDEFRCPHSEKPWHQKAVELVMEIEQTPSERVAALLRQDLEDILREQGFA